MDTTTDTPIEPAPRPIEPIPAGGAMSRRQILRVAALAGGGGIVAAGLAACSTSSAFPTGGWSTPALAAAATATASAGAVASAAPSTDHGAASPSTSAMPMASLGPAPAGWTEHDLQARHTIRRYIGNLAPALKNIYPEPVFTKLAGILGAEDGYAELTDKPSFAKVPQLVLSDAVSPLTPELDGEVKVFRLTIDDFEHSIDELSAPVAAVGYNAQWPGPTIRVTQGDRVRIVFTNNLAETTSVHFHGVEFDDFFEDGVAFITQKPIVPGETYTYEFVTRNSGSLMYHSHHNATDQVGRGLLGAFIVEPRKDPIQADREYVWISNDTLGGFTINGHGFPAVVPVVVAIGETVRVRFMNEGLMMHPWHLHGTTMEVVERDGWPLGSAAFKCDTLGVNPGERFDVLIRPTSLGVWAFHCHILSHAEGPAGMFGMVNTMIVVPDKAHVDAIMNLVLA